MNSIGLLLESGFDGNPADPDRAESYYRQAHKLGNIDATVNLAFYYLNVSKAHHLMINQNPHEF